MKILQISTSDIGGGAEGSAWNLFQVYRARGHQSWLAVGTKLSADPDVIEIQRRRQMQVGARSLTGIRSTIDRLLGREDFNFPGARKLLRLVPERPDIVHAHNLHGGYFDLRFLVPLSRQVPVILNLRDNWLLTGHCAYSLGCERWKTGCGQCPDLGIYPAVRRDATAYNWDRKRRIYAGSRLYVSTVSQWLMDRVHQSMLRGIEYRMIHNGIDLEIFAPSDQRNARTQLGLPVHARIVLLIAHNVFKDYAVMEQAIERLESNQGDDLVFICLGRTDQDRLWGQGRIIYPGRERDRGRMALYYSAADLYIHAAKDEAFGKTIVESMACGTPVVATSVGGVPELIEDGISGFLVPPADSIALAHRSQQLLDDGSLRQQMGERACLTARKRFGLNRQADGFLNWYEEILTAEAGRHAVPNAD